MSRRPQRDFGALIGKSAELLHGAQEESSSTLPITTLQSGKGQPRREFAAASLENLAASIRERGILQPILVRKVGKGYEIVAGERRWRAAQLAGLMEVPVIIRDFTDLEARHIALIENLQREDLNTVDEVDAKLELVAATLQLSREDTRTRLMQMLREEPGKDHTALEQLFGSLGEQWQSFTRNKLKILKWPDSLLEAVRDGLTYKAAQVIAAAPQEHHPHLLAFAQSGGSVSEIKAEAQRIAVKTPPHPQAARVARVIGSQRWLAKLDPQDQQALDEWISKMPEVVRKALDK